MHAQCQMCVKSVLELKFVRVLLKGPRTPLGDHLLCQPVPVIYYVFQMPLMPSGDPIWLQGEEAVDSQEFVVELIRPELVGK